MNLFLSNNVCVQSCPSGAYRLVRYEEYSSGSNLRVVFESTRECINTVVSDDEGTEIYGFDVTGEDDNELDIIIKC